MSEPETGSLRVIKRQRFGEWDVQPDRGEWAVSIYCHLITDKLSDEPSNRRSIRLSPTSDCGEIFGPPKELCR